MGVYPELEHLLLDRRVPLHVDIVAIEIGELLGVEQIAIDGQVADLRVLEDPGREGRRLQAVLFEPEGLQLRTLGHVLGQGGYLVLVQVQLGHIQSAHLGGHLGDPVPRQIEDIQLLQATQHGGKLFQLVVAQVHGLQVGAVGQRFGQLRQQIVHQQEHLQLGQFADHLVEFHQSVATEIEVLQQRQLAQLVGYSFEAILGEIQRF